MVEVSCKEKILGSMHLLTNSESKIANFVLENFNETLDCNVSELADNAGVSDASVVRFCKSVGYKGFQDFKISAAKDVLPHDRYYNPSLEQNDDAKTICRKIFDLEMAALNRTFSLINFSDMMAASLLTERDVAVCFSHSGSNRNVLGGMKIAHENGATTIALTGQGKTPIANLADIVITGEGRLDGQTVMGKAPIGVAKAAKKYGKKVFAFSGCVTEEAMKSGTAARNLSGTAEQVFRLIQAVDKL